jgi:hypothetical protein
MCVMLFIGSTRSRRLVDRSIANGWGRLFCCEKPGPRPGEPWALDNGAFPAWKAGKPWSAAKFLRSVEQSAKLEPPMLAVLPDKVAEGAASLDWSLRWLAELPPLPWYLAVQDGMTREAVAAALPHVAGLFLGGSDAFKAQAPEWCALAHEHGKRFHYARVSTEARLRAAVDCGADSADSSQMLWSDEHWQRFERWWFDNAAQMPMFKRTA